MFLRLCVLLVTLSTFAEAYTEKNFDDGQTHNIDYAISEDVVNISSYTEVILEQGGTMDSEVYVYGSSAFHLSGGQIIGKFHGISAYGTGEVVISDGTVGGYVYTYDDSQATVEGGAINNVFCAMGNSNVTVSGGEMMLWVSQNSTASISGGKFNHVQSFLDGYLEMTGGEVDETLKVYGDSTAIISGGKFNGFILSASEIFFEGVNFMVNGNPVEYGASLRDYAIPTSYDGGTWLGGIISGTLANGGVLNNQFYIAEYDADIVCIPEPCTLSLLGLGGLGLLRKRRMSK